MIGEEALAAGHSAEGMVLEKPLEPSSRLAHYYGNLRGRGEARCHARHLRALLGRRRRRGSLALGKHALPALDQSAREFGVLS